MAGASEIRAGKAFIELSTKDAQLYKGLRKAEKRMRAWADSLTEIGTPLAGIGVGLLAPLLASAKQFASFGSELTDMADRTGISAERLSSLGYAAKMAGTDLSTVETAVRKMQKTLVEAAVGGGTAAESLAQLGISADALRGLKPEHQFELIADALSRVSDDTTRAALATEVFGRSGTALLPMLSRGVAGLREVEAEAHAVGATMTNEDAVAADKFDDAMASLVKTLGGLTRTIGAALAPVLTDLTRSLQSAARSTADLVTEHRGLVLGLAGTGAGLTAVGGALLGLGGAFKLAAIAAGTFRTSLIFITAHPVAAALIGIGAGLALVTGYLYAAGRNTSYLKRELAELTGEGDRQRAADLAKVERLRQFAAQTELTGAEMLEAAQLAAELEQSYGALGITIDKTNSTLSVSAQALRNVAAAMREATAVQLGQEFEEAAENFRALTKQINSFPVAGLPFRSGDVEYLTKVRDEVYDKMTALSLRRAALKEGDPAALTGGKLSAPPTQPLPLAARGGQVNEWDRRIHELRLGFIEDENERALALLNARYDEEVRQAREAGATRRTLAQIEEARQLEAAKLVQDAWDRYYAQAADQQGRIDEANADRGYRIEELKARLKFGEDEVGLARELLELEERRAREQAAAAGENLELVAQEFALRRQLMDAHTAAMSELGRLEVAGSFDARVLNQMIGVAAPMKDMVAVAKRIEVAVDRIERKPAAHFIGD